MTFEDVKRIRENPEAAACDDEELHRLIDVAIDKQIPGKPSKGERGLNAHCPDCGASVFGIHGAQQRINGGITFCEVCGKAITWEGFYE